MIQLREETINWYQPWDDSDIEISRQEFPSTYNCSMNYAHKDWKYKTK